MDTGKRYFWLKLKEDFFKSKRIKKLRRMGEDAGKGGTYILIYLKMQLLTLKTEGILTWTGLEEDAASEFALDMDEDEEDVRVVLEYLLSCGLAETVDNTSFFLPYAVENTGSETANTQRSREYRARQTLQCNNDASSLHQECNNDASSLQQNGRVEIEIEKEKEKDIEIECVGKSTGKPRSTRFIPPSLDEVKAYVRERGSTVDPVKFYDYYSTGKWMDSKGNPVNNWKQKLITWERKEEVNDGRGTAGNKSVSGKGSGDYGNTPKSRYGPSEYKYDN